MHQAQLLAYGVDGRMADQFRDLAQSRGWWFRPLQQVKACFNLLRRGGPAVLVLKIGRDLERELTLLERIGWLFPETATIVIGDSDDLLLAGLVWDLGASCVMLPPASFELLAETVQGFLPAKTRPLPQLEQ